MVCLTHKEVIFGRKCVVKLYLCLPLFYSHPGVEFLAVLNTFRFRRPRCLYASRSRAWQSSAPLPLCCWENTQRRNPPAKATLVGLWFCRSAVDSGQAVRSACKLLLILWALDIPCNSPKVWLSDCRQLGPALVLSHMWSQLRLDRNIEKAFAGRRVEIDVAAYARTMVLNRLIAPVQQDKATVLEWAGRDFRPRPVSRRAACTCIADTSHGHWRHQSPAGAAIAGPAFPGQRSFQSRPLAGSL